LGTFVKNMKKKIIGVINYFISFLRKYDERITHNLQVLMLDPRFKSLKLIFSFIGCEHEVAITEKYDRKSLFLMLLKIHHHLHPLFEAKNFLIYIIDVDRNLDIF
jgi:hypothetical protein